MYTSTAVSSFTSQEESTHLLWPQAAGVIGVPQVSASWVGTGTENTPLPHVPVRKCHISVQKAAQALGRQLDEAGPRSTPADQVHWTCQGYYKGSTVENFHGGSVLYFNWIKPPGNTRAEGKEMGVLWVNHVPHCKKGIKGHSNERAGINAVHSLIAPLGRIYSSVIWLLLKARNRFSFPIPAIYYCWLLKAMCTADLQDGRFPAPLLIFTSVKKCFSYDRQRWQGHRVTPSALCSRFTPTETLESNNFLKFIFK